MFHKYNNHLVSKKHVKKLDFQMGLDEAPLCSKYHKK